MRDKIQQSIGYLMGKVGEKLIERLFCNLDFDVYPNGFEASHPAFVSYMRRRRVHGNQFKKYRVKADFAVVKEAPAFKDGLCCEIEIKFRSKGAIKRDDLKAYDKDVRFILISRDHFWSATHEQIKEAGRKNAFLNFDAFTLLEDDAFYQFSTADKKLIRDYKKLIAMFMPPEKELQAPVATRAVPAPKQAPAWTAEESEKLREEYRQLLIIYSHDEAALILSEEFSRSAEAITAELSKE